MAQTPYLSWKLNESLCLGLFLSRDTSFSFITNQRKSYIYNLVEIFGFRVV